MRIVAVCVLLSAGCASAERQRQDAADVVAAGRGGEKAPVGGDARVRAAFELGQLQATKSLHAAIQRTQQDDGARPPADTHLVPLTIPERTVDGVILNPGVEYVRLPH